MAEQTISIRVAAKDDTGGVFGDVKRKLDALKSVAGGRGDIKEFGEVLTGGGAVAGLTFVARTLREASDGALKLKNDFASGAIGVGQLMDQAARGVPIFGQLYAAGRSIREILTGEQSALNDALARQTTQIKLANDALTSQVTILGNVKRAAQEAAEARAAAEGRQVLAGADGFVRDNLQQQQAAEQRVAALRRQRDAELAKVEEERKKREAQIDADVKGGKLTGLDQKVAINANAKSAFEARQKIIGEFHAAELAEQRATDAERERFERERADADERAIRDRESRVTALEAEANANRLRAQGKTLEAEIAQINEARRQKLEALERDQEAQLKNAGPGMEQRIRDAYKREAEAINRAAVEARGQAADKDAEERGRREARGEERGRKKESERRSIDSGFSLPSLVEGGSSGQFSGFAEAFSDPVVDKLDELPKEIALALAPYIAVGSGSSVGDFGA